MDQVTVDVEIQRTIEETPGGWDATDKINEWLRQGIDELRLALEKARKREEERRREKSSQKKLQEQ